MVALHIWSMSHGIASLFGRGDAARRPLPMSPEELLEAGVLVYLRGLGIGARLAAAPQRTAAAMFVAWAAGAGKLIPIALDTRNRDVNVIYIHSLEADHGLVEKLDWASARAAWIALMILGFISRGGRIGSGHPRLHPWERTNGLLDIDDGHEPLAIEDGAHAGKMDRVRARMERAGSGGDCVGLAPPSSGNRAFDEYRTETLQRLEEEQREFTEFLERLRFAKDRPSSISS